MGFKDNVLTLIKLILNRLIFIGQKFKTTRAFKLIEDLIGRPALTPPL